jgi:hypothetical protein
MYALTVRVFRFSFQGVRRVVGAVNSLVNSARRVIVIASRKIAVRLPIHHTCHVALKISQGNQSQSLVIPSGLVQGVIAWRLQWKLHTVIEQYHYNFVDCKDTRKREYKKITLCVYIVPWPGLFYRTKSLKRVKRPSHEARAPATK